MNQEDPAKIIQELREDWNRSTSDLNRYFESFKTAQMKKKVIKMQFCTECGTEKLVGAKFCSSCGTRFEHKKVCPSCRTEGTPGAKFCRFCGCELC